MYIILLTASELFIKIILLEILRCFLTSFLDNLKLASYTIMFASDMFALVWGTKLLSHLNK